MHRLNVSFRVTVHPEEVRFLSSFEEATTQSAHPFFEALILRVKNTIPNDDASIVFPEVRPGSEILTGALYLGFNLVTAFTSAFNLLQGGMVLRRLIGEAVVDVYGPEARLGEIKTEPLMAQADETLTSEERHAFTAHPQQEKDFYTKRPFISLAVLFGATLAIFFALMRIVSPNDHEIASLQIEISELSEIISSQGAATAPNEFYCVQENIHGAIEEQPGEQNRVRVYKGN